MRSRLAARPPCRLLVVDGVAVMFVAALAVRAPLANAAMVPVPWLKTVGNKIVTANTDQEVTLRGANVMRSEWELKMDLERAVIPIMAGQWKGNVILRGFASDPVNGGDSQYLGMLDEHMSLAEANHMYVIFAWRSYGIDGAQPNMPDDQAQQALVKLAQRYRGKPNVMYALQVEPHDVTWSQVQPRYVQMVDAIRTASSPYKPIIMVPGVDWSRATAPWHGKAAISVDGSSETTVDFCSPSHVDQALVYISPPLVAAAHTVSVRVTGTKNTNSTGTVVTADRADVVTSPPLTINDNTVGAGPNQFQHTGIWSYATGSAGRYQGDDHFSNTTGATARITLTG